MKLWNIILWISLFILAMVLLTYLVPDINTFAKGIADQKDLPLWIVALFAPVLFLFKKIGDFFKGFTGESKTEREIRELNEQIKAEMKEIRQQVDGLDSWLKEKINEEMQHIKSLNARIAVLQGERAVISEQIEQVEEMDASELVEGMTEEQQDELIDKFLSSRGLNVKEAEIID